MKYSFDTPILFIIFNRPDTTQIVFNRIKEIKPKYLFIAADGPRLNVSDEVEKCEKTRKIINQIDWDCELKTLFRSENLGCGKGVSSAITWFFDHVEQGIILEDDCVPDLSFFQFAELMLEKYRKNLKVKMVAGTNLLGNNSKNQESYYFSQYFSIWGWATWKRAWNEYDFYMRLWPEIKSKGILTNKFKFKRKTLNKYWSNIFDRVFQGKIDTWDYQWFFACLINDGLSIVSKNNLISNIGYFGVHSNGDSKFLNMRSISISISSIKHPKSISANVKLDYLTYKDMGVICKPIILQIKFFRYRFLHGIKKVGAFFK